MNYTPAEFEYRAHEKDIFLLDSESDLTLTDVIKSANVALQMLRDRGYRSEWKKEVIPSKLNSENVITELGLIGESPEKGLIQVFWSLSPQFLKEEAQYFINEMNKLKSRRGIFIVSKKHTYQTKKLIKEQIKKGITIQFFQIEELLYDFSKHDLLPVIRLLNAEEKKELMSRYQIENDSQLPKMLVEDPIARYYGFDHQQVLMIKRLDNTITYRVVW